MLLRLGRITHQKFSKGQSNRCSDRRAAQSSRFTPVDSSLEGNQSRTMQLERLPLPSNPYDRMLGYPIVFIDCMLRVNRYSHARAPVALRTLFFLAALLIVLAATTTEVCSAQQGRRLPAPQGGVANLEAKTQSRKGDVSTADGDVDIHYADTRLRADHVEYNGKTYEAIATGHVQLDYGNEHLEAAEARYNVSTGHGLFHNVRGTVKIERRPNPELLISDNPLYFEARDVERFPAGIYLVHKAWITICDPEHPKWQFYAPNARIHLDKTVALVNANFRLFRVPLIWLPYATAPAGRRVRASGVLIPDVGQSSRKGFILGDAVHEPARCSRTWIIPGQALRKYLDGVHLLWG